MPNVTDINCGDCRYYVGDLDCGACRRYAPEYIGETFAAWPTVDSNDGCGDYRPRCKDLH